MGGGDHVTRHHVTRRDHGGLGHMTKGILSVNFAFKPERSCDLSGLYSPPWYCELKSWGPSEVLVLGWGLPSPRVSQWRPAVIWVCSTVSQEKVMSWLQMVLI